MDQEEPTKGERTAARIQRSAARLFMADGYQVTSVAKVAADAGVATGTVLLHFGSKSALAASAFASAIAEAVQQAAASIPGTSAQDDIVHLVAQLYQWYDERQAVAEPLLREALFADRPEAGDDRPLDPLQDDYADTVMRTIFIYGQIIHRHHPDLEPDIVVRISENLLGSYLLVLLRRLRGLHADVASMVDHFSGLAEVAFAAIDSEI